MSKRILNCCASDFAAMGREELLHAIAASEGRTLMAETIGAVPPLLGDVTNAELAAAMGADFLLLNLFDVQKPAVQGLPDHAPADTLRLVKQLTGRPVGINLEPGKAPAHSADPWALTPGRCATAENARLAADLGADLILLTGNPGNGIGNAGILRALREIRAAVGSRLILAAGKMHASGVLSEGAESILTPEEIDDFAAACATPGTAWPAASGGNTARRNIIPQTKKTPEPYRPKACRHGSGVHFFAYSPKQKRIQKSRLPRGGFLWCTLGDSNPGPTD